MTHHEHRPEDEITEDAAEATEEARRRRGEEGVGVDEPPDPLTVEDDEGEDEVRAY